MHLDPHTAKPCLRRSGYSEGCQWHTRWVLIPRTPGKGCVISVEGVCEHLCLLKRDLHSGSWGTGCRQGVVEAKVKEPQVSSWQKQRHAVFWACCPQGDCMWLFLLYSRKRRACKNAVIPPDSSILMEKKNLQGSKFKWTSFGSI